VFSRFNDFSKHWPACTSQSLLLRPFGIRATGEPVVTEEEVRALVDQGQRSGVFFPAEKELVERALVLDKLTAGDLMTPRGRVVWLNIADTDEVNWRKVVAGGHSYFPVYDRRRDHVPRTGFSQSFVGQPHDGRDGEIERLAD
jgi:putative hemolysin